MKTAKVLELVEILKEMHLPLTIGHISLQKYMIDSETHFEISPTLVHFCHMTFTNKHLEISIRPKGKAMISLYSDFDDSSMDQLIIDTVNHYNNTFTKKAILEKLISEKNKIEFKIKSFENETSD